jgi:phage shock protein A
MTDVGIALDRAEDKRAKMKTKFQALDQTLDSDVLMGKDNFEAERIIIKGSVDEELAKLKAERQRKKK